MTIKKLLLSLLVVVMFSSSSFARSYHHHHHGNWGIPVGIAIGALAATATYNSTHNYPYRYPNDSSYYRYNYINPVIYRNSNVIVYDYPIQRETIIIDPYTGNQTKYITIYR